MRVGTTVTLLVLLASISGAVAAPEPRTSGPAYTEIPSYAMTLRRTEVPVSLIVAVQKTAMPRTTDTPETARREHMRSVAAMVRLRPREDANFLNRAKKLASRMAAGGRFGPTQHVGRATTGEEFLAILAAASREGPIRNLVIYGHSGPTGLYMHEDRGFYVSLAAVAEASALVAGSNQEREDRLRDLGARDLGDLVRLIGTGDVRVTRDVVIVLTGCSAAGESVLEPDGFAAQTSQTVHARVFSSVGETDQSMTGSTAHEYSRGNWVRFAPDASPNRLQSRTLDIIKQLNPDDVSAFSVGKVRLMPAPGEGLIRQCSCMPPAGKSAMI